MLKIFRYIASLIYINIITFYSPNQQIINGISLPQQPLPLVQHQQQYVHQQHPSTSKTTIIKHEVPNNTPLAVQQIQVHTNTVTNILGKFLPEPLILNFVQLVFDLINFRLLMFLLCSRQQFANKKHNIKQRHKVLL